MDCAEEIAILKRVSGPLAGGEDKFSFDLLNGRMIVESERPVSDDEVIKVVAHAAPFYALITTSRFQGHSKRPPNWRCPRLKKYWPVSFFSIILLATAVQATANEGVFLSGYDSVQLQRMNSGVASPRNASWLILNPAGIGALDELDGDKDLNRQLDLNLYAVFTDVEFNPGGLAGNPFQGTLDGDGTFVIPSCGIIWPLTEKHTVGLGLYTLSGAGVEYEGPRNVLGFLGNSDRQLSYSHTRLALGYSYEINEGLYIGISLQGSLSRFKTDHQTLQLMPTRGDNQPDYAPGYGLSAGIYKKWDRWGLGASYWSRHVVERFDDYSDLLQYPIDLPQSVQLGGAYEIIDDMLEVTVDLRWIDWNDIATFGRPVNRGGFDWNDQFGIRAGLELKASRKLTLRAGFSYTNTPIERDHIFTAALVPVLSQQHIAAGFTYELFDGHEVSLTGIYAMRKQMEETGAGVFDGDFLSPLGKGSDLTTSGYAVSLGYTIKWGGRS